MRSAHIELNNVRTEISAVLLNTACLNLQKERPVRKTQTAPVTTVPEVANHYHKHLAHREKTVQSTPATSLLNFSSTVVHLDPAKSLSFLLPPAPSMNNAFQIYVKTQDAFIEKMQYNAQLTQTVWNLPSTAEMDTVSIVQSMDLVPLMLNAMHLSLCVLMESALQTLDFAVLTLSANNPTSTVQLEFALRS